jgi:hypothetical protein
VSELPSSGVPLALLLPPRVAALLSPLGQGLVVELFDDGLRARVVAALDECAAALQAVDRLEVERFEVFERDAPDVSVWSELAPAVADFLMALRRLAERLGEQFPRPLSLPVPDFDLDFELLSSAPPGHPSRLSRDGSTLDRLVAESATAPMTTDFAVAGLLAMLKDDLDMVTSVLRDPRVVASRVRLLSELEEWKARATQCVEALAAAILRPLGDHLLSELLPRYVTELDRSVRLREGVRALEAAVRRIRAEVDAGRAVEAAVAEVGAHLKDFQLTPAFGTLWARDRREVMVLGAELARAAPLAATQPRAVVDRMEALLRFLNVLADAISRRPELEAYDRENEALAALL